MKVLTCSFAPDDYDYRRSEEEYMGLKLDSDKRLLEITSPDPDAILPGWITDRLPVAAVMKIDQSPARKKTPFWVEIKEVHENIC